MNEQRELRWDSPTSESGKVLPPAVPSEDHLGGVRDENNVLVLTGDETGEMVYLGKGSGKLPIAAALRNDVIGLFPPSHSRTGRFPRAVVLRKAPRFATFPVREAGASVLADDEREGAIPLLESMVWPAARR
jgi:hypothetical protein